MLYIDIDIDDRNPFYQEPNEEEPETDAEFWKASSDRYYEKLKTLAKINHSLSMFGKLTPKEEKERDKILSNYYDK